MTAQASSYQVLSELGSSARAIALGNVDGFSDSRTAVFSNPAALTNINHVSVSAFTSTIMEDLNYISGSINSDLPIGKVGIGYYAAQTADLYSTYETNNNQFDTNGSFEYRSAIIKLSYQLNLLKNTSIASSYAIYNQESSGISGTGTNVDIGIIQRFRRMDISIFAQNIIRDSMIDYKDSDSKSESLPLIISASAKIPVFGFTLLPQIKSHDDIFLYSCGLSYSPSFFTNLELLSGYKQQLDALNNIHNKVSVGLGLSLMGLELNYSYEKSDYFLTDNTNYFSVSFGF